MGPFFQNLKMELEGDSGPSLFAPEIHSFLQVGNATANERAIMRDARMQNQADAKAFGAVTSKTVRVSERWKGSGTRSGECVSIFPDGTRIPFVKTRAHSDTPKPRTVSITRAAQTRTLIQSITLDHDYNAG